MTHANDRRAGWYLIDIRTRLVDSQNDGAAALRQALDGIGDVQGIGRGQARCGFIQEQHAWAGQQLDTNGHATLLTARDSADDGASDLGVLDVGQVELLHHSVDTVHLLFVGHGARQTHLGRKSQCLQDTQGLDEI